MRRGPLRTGGSLAAGLVVLLLASCDGRTVRAPAPEVLEDLPRLEELPVSYLSAPIRLDLRSIVDRMDREVPGAFGDIEHRVPHPSNERVHVAFEVERGPFEAHLDGTRAYVQATLRYRGRGWYDPPLLPEVSASCGTAEDEDNRPRATASLSSNLSVAPDWSLESHAAVDWIRPASDRSEDACRVTTFGIDVTQRVIRAAREQLARRTGTIDAAVAEVDLRSRIERVWEILRTPIELTDDVWLVIDPFGVYHSEIVGSGTTLEVQVGLAARPRILLGPRPELQHLPLPALQHAALEDELHILLEGEADYSTSEEMLNRELAGRELELGGNTFRIRRIGMSGIGGGRVALEVAFDGAARGTVYLVGTPEFDEENGLVHVPDLDFDLATQNVLVRGLAWIRRGHLVEFLRERARIPADEALALATEQLERGLNRQLSDEVRIEGEVGETRVLGVRALTSTLILQAHAEARARLFIDPAG